MESVQKHIDLKLTGGHPERYFATDVQARTKDYRQFAGLCFISLRRFSSDRKLHFQKTT